MSETYTIGGDALYLLKANHIAGQTFTPLESHIVDYLDLNLKSSLATAPPKVQIYLTNHLNEPTGDPLVNITIHPPSPIIPSINRVRVKIPNPFILHEGTEYALLCLYELPIIGTRASWEYDSTSATYPRGHRIHSNDGGATWTHELTQDHIFCEFGDPPLPKPEPEPPVEHFAPVGIKYTPTWFGLLISLSTNVPCHLTCYYTDKKPLKHRTSRTLRGLTIPWGTYFCFVGWHALEQLEGGDTLYHTFNFEEWPVCLTRWFTIRGNIDDKLSPSVGPIFKYHNFGLDHWRIASGPDDTHRNYPDIWTSTGAVNYLGNHVRRFGHSLRFTNIPIPHRARITEAYLTYTANSTRVRDMARVKIHGNYIDNAIAPVSLETYDTMILTSAFTLWHNISHWELNKEYDSPSLTTIVQEIISRPGWAAGNAIQFRIDDDSSDFMAARLAYSYDNIPAMAPVLHIRYS